MSRLEDHRGIPWLDLRAFQCGNGRWCGFQANASWYAEWCRQLLQKMVSKRKDNDGQHIAYPVIYIRWGSSTTMTSEVMIGPFGPSQKRSTFSFDQSMNICLSYSERRTSGGATPWSTLWNLRFVISNTSGFGRATYPTYSTVFRW